MLLSFHKYEGLGNDFLIVEGELLGEAGLTAEQALALCDRHRGVGADGVLILDLEKPSMRVINADGSVPEMCGNGLRCAALHLARRGGDAELEVSIDSGAGTQRCRVRQHGAEGTVRVHLQGASFRPQDIGLQSKGPWRDERIDVDGRELVVTAVSMGNPHLVTFDDVGEARFALGEALQADPRFSAGINVGFASELTGDAMRLDVLERGAGWTQACGTGAAAAAVAAVETGRAKRGAPLRVDLPGGSLLLSVDDPGEAVTMEGPARFVFRGEVTI